MPFHREELEGIARRAIYLLLVMGRETYRADLLERKDQSSVTPSPFAEYSVLNITERAHLMVGLQSGYGMYRFSSVLVCNGYTVEVACELTCDSAAPRLCRIWFYLGDTLKVLRNISIEPDGSFDPWGAPEDFDVAALLENYTFNITPF